MRDEPPTEDSTQNDVETDRALDWMRRRGVQPRVLSAVDRKVRQRRRRALGWACGLALTGCTAAFFAIGRFDSKSEFPGSSTVVVLAPARETLPDGTMVEKKGDARLTVEFTGATRRVRLHQGEAHFHAAKQPGRPFVVNAGDVDIQAVGTAFAVQLSATSVGVLVTEGRVAVSARVSTPNGEPPPATMVSAGQFMKLQRASEAEAWLPATPMALAPEEQAEQLAWRIPRLEFARTPLSEVVALINRNSDTRGQPRFVLDPSSPELGQVEISGFLRQDNIAGLIYLLETQSGIRAEHRGSNEIILRKDVRAPN